MPRHYKYILYWLAFAFLISSMYIYRTDAKKFAAHFVSNLIPGYAIESSDGSIEVSAGQGGHFYVNTQLNGISTKFLVDTGASTITIDKRLAKAIGIDIKKLKFNQIYTTANGTTYGASAKVDVLAIGSFKIRDLYVSVSEKPLETPLLGMSFLSRLESYTFEQDKLVLRFKKPA